jgi:urea transporter/murein DD-endopeptidase MepM/ murein hydrolase activator NlpD
VKEKLKFFGDSIACSYSQVFFSDNKWFALLLGVSTFVDPYTGFSGLLCVVFAVILAQLLGFNPLFIRNGSYTYNVLLVGLAIGFYFSFNLAFFVILFLASFLTLMISAWMASSFGAKRVPFLSLPFVFGTWIMLLSTRTFQTIKLSERIPGALNHWGSLGGASLISIYHKTSEFIPHLAVIYFKSIGAIFFQYNIVSGLLITIGLLVCSRIAFSLSLIGFICGYFFSYFIQGDMSELEYSYIGFNFILSAIAIGGFFFVPSGRSYLLAIISAPLIVLVISGLGTISASYQLPLYSLPFSFVVMLVIYVMENRYTYKSLHLVEYQKYSPEKNLYAFHNNMERFKNDTYVHVHLPYYGEWFVSQGHNGTITHKDDFRYAWDFVITDENKKTYRNLGTNVKDFYCYEKPVLAPADGLVVSIEDGVDDNMIGDVNVEKNWGNTIIIKHTEYLFSKLSHLKNDSFKVKQGDYVKKGDLLAVCGNSGRSPEPHVHFQLQSTAYLNAGTLNYPICYYLTKEGEKYVFHSFENPNEGETVLKATPTPLISHAFHFIPGMKLNFEVKRGDIKTEESWEVFADSANETYIYCKTTGSIAFFTNNETLHYFINFKGDKNSLLYYFYLGANKVLLGYYPGVEIKDALPISGFYGGLSKFLQDFTAPFHIYLKANYSAQFSEIDNEQNPGNIKIISTAFKGSGNKGNDNIDFEIELSGNRLSKFTVNNKSLCITAENIV